MGSTVRDPKEGQQARSRLAGLSGAKLGTLSLSALENAASQQNLQVLDLKDNKISAVPKEVYHAFTQVRVLDLRKNALEELLPDLSVMRSLEDLLVDQNRLQEIPAEVCALPYLKTLSLSQNVLKSLPKAIGAMSALRSLSLGDNHIDEIPAELGQCKELQTLYFHHNHFTKLPSSLYQLENLTELALEWFRYTTPPLPRVIKGLEWKRIITKFLTICKEKKDKNEAFVTCIEILSQFSQKTFDPNAIDSKRRTRLHVACLEGHVGVAMALAENGSKCDSLDCEGYSPLLVAVREEHPDIATALVRVGVDVNRGGGLFGSPLHVATVNFDPHMVLLLIHGKADVNQTDADGNTPLHVLMSVFDKGGKRAGAIGQILLRHNADCNIMNSDKWAPLHLAARRGQLRGICFVLSHIDSMDSQCLKGICMHQPAHKKSKSSRVRTCTRAFDLNLRGGSHLWTPLHLAGHACHVPVAQVLIEAGADVFLRNIDGRTARHVSRGNLAISKLLRKAEDEWLWYRVNQRSAVIAAEASAKEAAPQESDARRVPRGNPQEDAAPDVGSRAPPNLSPRQTDTALLDSLKNEDDDDDAIEEYAKHIEGSSKKSTMTPGEGEGNTDNNGGGTEDKGCSTPDPGGPPPPKPNHALRSDKMHRMIMEKCCDTHFTKVELQQLQANNFATPASNIEEFLTLFSKLTQQGQRHRLMLLFSKPWVKELTPKLLEDERCQGLLLQTFLVIHEDFIRMLICNLPRERLSLFGKVRNQEQETMLHVLCSGPSARAYPSAASRADVLSMLLTLCPQDTFDLEARDLRGQTALHLAAQSGDIGLVQVLLEGHADPNAQEETTGWTPLHFAVAKAHYALILQLLHHDGTNVNQADKFDWPPLLEACSRLDARSTSLLVNGGANLGFRNQHEFDVLKAVDTSKKDLAAKRWMSCLVVSNGFRFQESTVQLNQEDRETFERECAFHESRPQPQSHPPFYVPDHLAPRCHSCKVLFAVTVRRYHCRSCGLVLCADCFKWRATSIVALDERLKVRQRVAQSQVPRRGIEEEKDREEGNTPLNESRLTAAVEMSMREKGGIKNGPGPISMPPLQPSCPSNEPSVPAPAASVKEAPAAKPVEQNPSPATLSPNDDSFEDPPLAEELPAVGPPMSVVCPASMMSRETAAPKACPKLKREARPVHVGLSRQRPASSPCGAESPMRMVRLCGPCAAFFEAGVGETYAMLQRKEALTGQI